MAYEKQTFINEETVITAEHFNHIEDGIVAIETAVGNAEAAASNAQGIAEQAASKADNAATAASQAQSAASQAASKADTATATANQAKTAAEAKQDKLVSGTNIKTVNGQSLLGDGNIEISGGVSSAASQDLKILFIGNSLTQDAVSYLPLLLDEIAPEISYTIYDWYNGGHTLAQQYSKITENTPCENFGTITNNQAGGWDVQRNVRTMQWVCENCDFDAVVLQEYSYYDFTDAAEVTNFNNIISYLRSNYGKPFKVFTFIDAPMRTRIEGDYAKAKKYAKLHITDSIAEGLVNPGSAVVYGLEDALLRNLGDKGQLSADGTHTQEGLPCMLQSYVLALWVFEWMGIPKSIINSKTRMTAALYSAWQSFGPNLGNGVVEGTEAQYIRAQEIAVRAHKFGKQLLNSAISTFNEGIVDNPGTGGGGSSGAVTSEIFVADGCLSSTIVVGGEAKTFANQYTVDYDVYKVSVDATKTYTATISHGLYDSEGDPMIVLVICDANGVVLGYRTTKINVQDVHDEQFVINMREYAGASYMLMTVHTSNFSVVEGELPQAEITVAHTGTMFKSANAVGSVYQAAAGTQYTTDYNIYKASNTAGGKYNLVINHGLYSDSGTNAVAFIICDSAGIALDVVRTKTNVQKVRTEIYEVDMSAYSNASYFVFVTMGAKYVVNTVK